MEWIIPMTAGLLLDICGTFFILKTFVFSKYRMMELETLWFTSNFGDEFLRSRPSMGSKPKTNTQINLVDFQGFVIKFFRILFEDAKWGFVFLFIGFTLQIIANMINYY